MYAPNRQIGVDSPRTARLLRPCPPLRLADSSWRTGVPRSHDEQPVLVTHTEREREADRDRDREAYHRQKQFILISGGVVSSLPPRVDDAAG